MPIICTACSSSNRDGAKFCAECGMRLAAVCPSCGAPATGGRFCSECGTPLATEALAAPLPRGEATPTPVAERRRTSVLFADLVGFTPLSEARDAEEVRDLLSRYFETARTVIARYGGVVEKFIGDAVMAGGGAPGGVGGGNPQGVPGPPPPPPARTPLPGGAG